MFRTLISPTNLAEHLHDPLWVVVDCRHDLAQPKSGRIAYREGHIPEARFASLDDDLSGLPDGSNGRHPLPSANSFVEFLKQCGVNDQSQVVAYDGSGGIFAARLWWMMRWIGHNAVAVLDGGFAAWNQAGRPLDKDNAPIRRGNIEIRAPLVDVKDAHQVRANLDTSAYLLIDARAAERYRGDIEPLDPVAGHIPGAASRPCQSNLDANGRFKPAHCLRDEFLALIGDRPATSVIHQCGSGVTACHNALAMEIAGLHGASLYAGSWSEWCSDASRPVAKGVEP